MQFFPVLDQQTFSTVIWLQTSFLGDVVINTGAFGLVKKSWPQVKQILITTGVGAAALKNHPDLDRVIVFHKKDGLPAFQRLKSEFKAGELERAVLLQPHKSFRSSLLARYLAVPTITYKETAGSFLAQRTVPRVSVLHEAVRQALLVEPLGITRDAICDVQLSLPRQDEEPTAGWAKVFAERDKILIGMAPGSVWGTKRWPKENYAALIKLLLDRFTNVKIILLGSRDEVEDCTEIATQFIDSDDVINIAGQTSLDELRWVYPRLHLLVANDSSPIHYASAFHLPTVAIFGATVPAMGFGPLAPRSQVAEVDDLDCRPCSDHGPQECPLKHFLCMKNMLPQRVMDLCVQVLMAR